MDGEDEDFGRGLRYGMLFALILWGMIGIAGWSVVLLMS